MEIKVCGMRESENIRGLIAEVRPDWMGLIFYPKSPRYVEDSLAPQISEMNVPKVGVFVNESIPEILEKIVKFDLAAIQLHGSEMPEFVEEINSKTDVEIWKVVSVGEELDWEDLKPYAPLVDKFLFDTATKAHGGSGRKFDWMYLETYPFNKSFLLSGGIDQDSAKEIWDLAEKVPQLKGVDLNSKFEISPALKEIEKLKEFKQNLLSEKRA